MKALNVFGKIATYLSAIFLALIFILMITGNEHLFKAIGNTYLVGRSGPSIDEYRIFDSRAVQAGNYKEIQSAENFNKLPGDHEILKKIESYDPVALLVLHNDELLYEKYWDAHSDESITNSFSVAKSIVGLGVGIAIDKGFIQNVDQKVIDFVPELKGEYREVLTIRHLLTMTSGMDFDESYGDPFGFMAKAYYGDELLKKTLSYSVKNKPGDEWKYLGGNTILLSIIVTRASGMNLSDFTSEFIWKPIGSESDALWNIDEENGIEKAYCCFYARAKDFARLGLLIENNGISNGQTVISQEYLESMEKMVILNNGEKIAHYGWHWWKLQYKNYDITYARGIFGQYIISIPEMDMVIVRLGNKRGEKNEDEHPVDVYDYIDFGISVLNQEN